MVGVTEVRGEVEDLYRSEGARLWSAVRAYSGDPGISDDAVAEAFAQLLRRGDEVRNPAAWVWTTAFRVAARELQRRRATVPDPPDTPYDAGMSDSGDGGGDGGDYSGGDSGGDMGGGGDWGGGGDFGGGDFGGGGDFSF